ncbi:hypothetical protein GALMADRAFT_1124098 [Galerina marginata CBS 339.88]|uniref:Uncharacterized protein n=1 Tax=Galerina marginata (strain CBS 339.88) TaxID=685588 RepID=A0A067TFS6_GALM3|nr:hypothetical protein GALMADRAFT_1124098 [Galerina marginata CBS 339.88]
MGSYDTWIPKIAIIEFSRLLSYLPFLGMVLLAIVGVVGPYVKLCVPTPPFPTFTFQTRSRP